MRLLHDLVDHGALRHGGRPAIEYRSVVSTYEQLALESRRQAAMLASLGIRRGDRVVVHLANRPEAVVMYLACSRVGAVFVPTSPVLKIRQLQHILRDCGARVLVASAVVVANVLREVGDVPGLEAACVLDGDASRVEVEGKVRVIPYGEADAGGAPCNARVIDHDVAALFYTSGTTGRPKGVVITHRNLVSGAECVAEYLGNSSADRILAALPLSFDYGFSQVSTALHSGACAVLSNFLSAAALLNELRSGEITGLAGVPTVWAQLTEVDWPQQPMSLRYVTNSGGAMTRPLLRMLRERLPAVRIFCMYGLTEAFRSTYLDPAQVEIRPESIGKAVPNQQVHVLRPDGSPCVPGEVGELVHRGSFVAGGYWGAPEQTAAKFRPIQPGLSGQMIPEIAVWSGDLVREDSEGFLYYVGRRDSQIKTSGIRVSAGEIEEVIAEVDGVLEVVAVGISDELLGQKIAVVIVPRSGTTESLSERVLSHCRSVLPTHMVPAVIELQGSLPMTPTGKLDRKAVGDALESKHGQAGEVAA